MLLIRIGFNANPDPAFYLNVDLDPEIQTSVVQIQKSKPMRRGSDLQSLSLHKMYDKLLTLYLHLTLQVPVLVSTKLTTMYRTRKDVARA
jgi:hypothetical protein